MSCISLNRRAKSHPRETIEKAKKLVSEHTGIIHSLYEVPCEPDGPHIFGYGSILANTERIGVPTTSLINGSTSLIREQAIAGAIGEAVERYSAAFIPDEKFILSPLRNLGDEAVDPRSLILYSEEQYSQPGFRYQRFDDNVNLRWVQGYSLTNQRNILVPGFAVYLPFHRTGGEPPIVQGISSGLACGNSIEEAILSGIYEVVERDAAMIMWLCRLSMPKLNLSPSVRPKLSSIIKKLSIPAEVQLIDVTTDIKIPSVVSVALSSTSKVPAFVVASNSSLNMEEAATGAVEELAQCVMWVRSLIKAKQAPDYLQDLSDVSSRIDHVLWPTKPEFASALSFMKAENEYSTVNGERTDTVSADISERIKECVRILARCDLEVIVVDVTSPDIEDVGLKVVRVIIPETQPLYFGHNYRRVADKRLRQYRSLVAESTGGAPDDILNPFPHPFP